MADFKQPFRARPITRRPANVLQFKRGRRRPRKTSTAWWAWGTLLAAPLLGVGVVWLAHSVDFSAIRSPSSLMNDQAGAEQYSVTFSECSGPVRENCVVDGDTFWLEGEKVRIADINTPEVSEPKCAEEARLGAEATQRLLELLNAGGFSLEDADRDTDRYGRKLRIVTRNGSSLGDTLVAEGLAESWKGYRSSWC